MNKKGQEPAEVFGWILVIFLVVVFLIGLFSGNVCDRLLIGVSIFGLIWIFFGSPIITRVEHERSGWVFFIPLSIVLLIIWIILKVSGTCSIATNLWQVLKQVLTGM